MSMQKESCYLALVSFQIRVVHSAIRACRMSQGHALVSGKPHMWARSCNYAIKQKKWKKDASYSPFFHG